MIRQVGHVVDSGILPETDSLQHSNKRSHVDKVRWSRFDGHEILLAESSNLYEKNTSKIYRQQDLPNPAQV